LLSVFPITLPSLRFEIQTICGIAELPLLMLTEVAILYIFINHRVNPTVCLLRVTVEFIPRWQTYGHSSPTFQLRSLFQLLNSPARPNSVRSFTRIRNRVPFSVKHIDMRLLQSYGDHRLHFFFFFQSVARPVPAHFLHGLRVSFHSVSFPLQTSHLTTLLLLLVMLAVSTTRWFALATTLVIRGTTTRTP
jgi:hypothetical protein